MTLRELTPIKMVKIQLLSNSGINRTFLAVLRSIFAVKVEKAPPPPYVGMGNEYWSELSVKLQLI